MLYFANIKYILPAIILGIMILPASMASAAQLEVRFAKDTAPNFTDPLTNKTVSNQAGIEYACNNVGDGFIMCNKDLVDAHIAAGTIAKPLANYTRTGWMDDGKQPSTAIPSARANCTKWSDWTWNANIIGTILVNPGGASPSWITSQTSLCTTSGFFPAACCRESF